MYGNDNCVLKKSSTKHSKYIVDEQFKHFIDVSFRESFVRIQMQEIYASLTKHYPSSQCIYITIPDFGYPVYGLSLTRSQRL